MEFEAQIIRFLQSGRCSFLDVSFQILTYLGSIYAVGVFCLLLLALRRKDLLWFILAYVFVASVVYLLKILVCRTRPYLTYDDIVCIGEEETDFCFPSGHSATITFIAIFCGFLLCQKFVKTWQKSLIIVGCTTLALLVALSRMYLGVHYLTDTLAGIAISAFLTSGVLFIRHFYLKKRGEKIENKDGN